MDAPLDLYRASREELIALVLGQREQIADLEQRLARQAAELATQRAAMASLTERVGALLAARDAAGRRRRGGRARRRMPGLKPAARRPPRPPAPPRKRRAHGYGRRRMRPTARQVHAYAHCPHCRDAAARRHASSAPARSSSWCRGRWRSPSTSTWSGAARAAAGAGCRDRSWTGVVVGQGRLGVGLLSLIAMLREELRLPVGAHPVVSGGGARAGLSVGAIVATLHTVAARAAPVVAQHPARRSGPVRWCTSMRPAGARTAPTATSGPSAPRPRALRARQPGAGACWSGARRRTTAGCWSATSMPPTPPTTGRHQYCWAHLLRDVDDLVGQHREDAAVRGWADAVQPSTSGPRRCHRSRPGASGGGSGRPTKRSWAALCAPYLGVRRRRRSGGCASGSPGTWPSCSSSSRTRPCPPTNNAAERSLRHLVTSRKISGGTRSPAGTATKMTLASLFGTWRLQAQPPDECRALLAHPQL